MLPWAGVRVPKKRDSQKRKIRLPQSTFYSKLNRGMIGQLEEINEDGTLNNMFNRFDFRKSQVIEIDLEYTIGGFQEQSTIQSTLDSDNNRSIPLHEIEIRGEKDMVENIIYNKGFKISFTIKGSKYQTFIVIVLHSFHLKWNMNMINY